ncbi:MAG: ATP-dependent DNA helicase RecG [Acidobacteria bacterium]|nr:ATP-dependent DNA helicase RecG [Acidobacteriota bacterium]
MTSARDALRPDDPLVKLKGVGPRSAEDLASEGFHTVLDLLLHLPRRYEDRTKVWSLARHPEAASWILLKGRVTNLKVRRIPRRRMVIVDGVIDDGSGLLAVVWFNQRWIHRRLSDEPELYLYGQVRERRGGVLQLVNPEVEEVADGEERVVPVYRRLGRFGGRRLRNLIAQCVEATETCRDPLPAAVRARFGLPPLCDALRELHLPSPPCELAAQDSGLEDFNSGNSPFHRRLAFDELLAFACAMHMRRLARRAAGAAVIDTEIVNPTRIAKLVPFELTGAQLNVLDEMKMDLGSGRPMSRLLQGDVGSGKTVVAALAMLMALDSGHQVAFMAPTELLAEQHARTFEDIFSAVGFTTHRLTGSMVPAAQRSVREGLADGSVRMVVGTHALFQESVTFRQLGLVVVDEQHRFGVAQRQALVGKGRAPHLLVMTATPIPRSLALTVYGDLDLSIIDEMPPGRRPVHTHLRFGDARPRVLDFLKHEIEGGGRVYVVFPIIDASEEIEAAALTEREAAYRQALQGIEVGVLHGRLDRSQREETIARFRRGTAPVLLSTTIVEVGVDVPEASVMVIESPQRFGLSQLHQLRGRVGRGTRQAWCILLADEGIGEDALRRLEVVCESTDGFAIAEADLKLRGPGELIGTKQWGPAGFRFANIFRERDLIRRTKVLAAELEASGELGEVIEGLREYFPIEVVLAAD